MVILFLLVRRKEQCLLKLGMKSKLLVESILLGFGDASSSSWFGTVELVEVVLPHRSPSPLVSVPELQHHDKTAPIMEADPQTPLTMRRSSLGPTTSSSCSRSAIVFRRQHCQKIQEVEMDPNPFLRNLLLYVM